MRSIVRPVLPVLAVLTCMPVPACRAQVQQQQVPQTARQAWQQLVGRPVKDNSPFAYVVNDPALPNVLLYGDSISIDYTVEVRHALQGKANVYRIHCNGGDSGSFIAKMKALHQAMFNPRLKDPWKHRWDVIHFNVGLHDLKYFYNGRLDTQRGKQVTSLEQYEKNLRAIVAYLRQLAPKATLIYCTTTPVPEHSAGRVAGDAARYNAVALRVMRECSQDENYPPIRINDLYTFTKPHQSQWWTRPGNVHFNAEGRKAQGRQVARIISQVLDERARQQVHP